MSAALSYRPHIDGLRAVAVLAVLVYHIFPGKLAGGFTGVDVFFVISGYLISRIILDGLARGTFRFADFYARRVRRIFPALCLVLATGLVLGWVALLPDEFAQLARHTVSGAGFVQNFRLWSEAGYFDNASEQKPLLHLWSLAIEEQFYLIYPVVLWAAWRRRWRPTVVIAVLATLSFAANLLTVRTDPVAAFFLPHTRMWGLLAGALLAALQAEARHEARAGWHAEALTLAGLAGLAGALVALSDGHGYPGWREQLPVGATVLLIYAGGAARLGRLLANAPMVWIGKISYPLYLWHWLLLAFCRIVDGAPARERNAVFVLSFVLAWLTWRLLETPLRHGGRPTAKGWGLATAMALVALTATWQPPQDGALFASIERARALNKFDYPDKMSCRWLTGVDTAEDWCNDGNAPGQAPTVALLGDSFANVYAGTLLEYATRRQPPGFVFRQVARGECPPLADYGLPHCRELVRAQAAYVARTPSIRTVVLAAHWPGYARGKDYAVLHENAARFDAAVRDTVERYQRLGRQVVVFLAPPTGANPRGCIPRPLHFNDKYVCQRTAEDARRSDGDYRAGLLPWLAQRNVAVFDPFPLLCDARQCKVMEREMILYADDMHLSGYGARWLARRAGGALDALLAPR
ncbi:acyltransferase family protein [[Empedobacter] haloabium]|uniref:Acyltransferase family protein n=1 Tax=[Empedobacter] haloabium TaxID=592317 RepID=A0ABZ1UNY4_9BURK